MRADDRSNCVGRDSRGRSGEDVELEIWDGEIFGMGCETGANTGCRVCESFEGDKDVEKRSMDRWSGIKQNTPARDMFYCSVPIVMASKQNYSPPAVLG